METDPNHNSDPNPTQDGKGALRFISGYLI